MGAADLTKHATLNGMTRLGSLAGDALEAAGREPTTDSELFEGRNGYDTGFLNGWKIDLPRAIGSRADDMRELRRGGTGVELKYRNFSVIMSIERRMPMLTAVNIDGSQSRSLPRATVWRFDGRLDKGDQWGDALYDSNSLDRGHMVRREDPVWGADAEEANKDTFHFTNSCPQMAGVNQVTWLGLENYVLQNARADGMRVAVFTGPFFRKEDLTYREAQVPAAFWKVVAIVTDDGRPSATAYKVSQAKELQQLEFVFAGYKTYQISINQVIQETEIDFSALVPFDGFSQHEHAIGERLEEPLESLENIRI